MHSRQRQVDIHMQVIDMKLYTLILNALLRRFIQPCTQPSHRSSQHKHSTQQQHSTHSTIPTLFVSITPIQQCSLLRRHSHRQRRGTNSSTLPRIRFLPSSNRTSRSNKQERWRSSGCRKNSSASGVGQC